MITDGAIERITVPQERARLVCIVVFAFIMLAPATFYWILFRHALNLPFLDDYDAVLGFLNGLAESHGFSTKLTYFLTAQHNEYKLFFANSVAWFQTALLGHVDFRILCAVGNGFILLLSILLWKIFLPGCKDLVAKLVCFLPVVWLIFQLQYVETLNWGGPSLQYLPALLFSFGAIYFINRPAGSAYYKAVSCLFLGIGASANGFLLVPIGTLILAQSKQYKRLAGWLFVSVECIATYAYHYHLTSPSSEQQSFFATPVQVRLLYLSTLIGNGIAPPFYGKFLFVAELICPLFGLMICAFFVAMTRRRYFRRNGPAAYCVLFLFLTQLGISGIRSELGAAEALSSRYGIYSLLLLIFAWFAIVEDYLQNTTAALRLRFIAAATGFAVLFCAGMDILGWRYLEDRNRDLIQGMAIFEHSNASPVIPVAGQPPSMNEFDSRARLILRESIRLRIYRPPKY